MSSRRSLRSRPSRIDFTPDMASNAGSRSTRNTGVVASSGPVTVSRSSPDLPIEPQKSIRLTVKMPSSKLREVTGGGGNATTAEKRNVNIFAEDPIVTGPRNSRSKKKIVEVDTSDEEDQDDDNLRNQEEDEVDDEEDVDADGDVDMDDAPPRKHVSKRKSKSGTASALPAAKPVKSVEAKEMDVQGHEDDEELSDPESEDREPEGLDESGIQDVMGDGNGDEEEGLDEEDEEDEEDIDTDQATPRTGSRMSTPDFNKLTKRQRGSLGNDFLQLPMEPQVKKHLTAEERAMRRAEMARRRKNLSEKRNEEEKMDTINRLLRKQAPKRRGRVSAAEVAEGVPQPEEKQVIEKPNPTMIRWVNDHGGCRVGVPEEWLGTPTGRMFGNGSIGDNGARKLVEEV